jgi:hypothetical protein
MFGMKEAAAQHLHSIKGIGSTVQSSLQPFLRPSVFLQASPAAPSKLFDPSLPSSPLRVMEPFYRPNLLLVIFDNNSPVP